MTWAILRLTAPLPGCGGDAAVVWEGREERWGRAVVRAGSAQLPPALNPHSAVFDSATFFRHYSSSSSRLQEQTRQRPGKRLRNLAGLCSRLRSGFGRSIKFAAAVAKFNPLSTGNYLSLTHRSRTVSCQSTTVTTARIVQCGVRR